MTPTLWIGFAFLFLLIVFLMLTFFTKDNVSLSQHNTLRFLTALCAGFAGGILSGEALFKLDTSIVGGAKMAISGTAGFALFFTIWFTYPKASIPIKFEDGVNFSIPQGWIFEAVVSTLVKASQGIYHGKLLFY